MSENKENEPKKPKGDRYALVYYIQEQETGIVVANSKISKRKMGTQVQVGYPIDWQGPIDENVQFDAKVVKFSYNKEFLEGVNVDTDGKEIKEKGSDIDNISTARAKVQQKAEKLAKKKSTLLMNQFVFSKTPTLVETMPISSDQASTSTSNEADLDKERLIRQELEAKEREQENSTPPDQEQSETEEEVRARLQVEKLAREEKQRLLDEQTKARAEEQARQQEMRRQAEAEEARQQEIRRQAEAEEARQREIRRQAEAEEAEARRRQERERRQNAIYQASDEVFDLNAFANIVAGAQPGTRLPLTVFPYMECLVRSTGKTPLGDSTNIFVPIDVAINVPWVVPRPVDAPKRSKVPEENPNAVYPQELVNYLLNVLVPHEIMFHVSGSLLPDILFNGIKDFINGRLHYKNKLLPKNYNYFISEYHRNLKKKMLSGKMEEQGQLYQARFI